MMGKIIFIAIYIFLTCLLFLRSLIFRENKRREKPQQYVASEIEARRILRKVGRHNPQPLRLALVVLVQLYATSPAVRAEPADSDRALRIQTL
jgi:hypothetical protein